MFIAEASPVHRVDVFLVLYKLSTPSPVSAPAPPANGIIVWPGPGRAICSARRAAPLPPEPGSARSPTPTLPARFVCASTNASRLRKGPRGRRKPARALPGPSPEPEGEKAKRPPNPAPVQHKAHARPPPFPVHPRAPVFASRLHTILVHPALSASLGCHSAAGLKPPFSREPEGGSRKPSLAGAGAPGEAFPSPAGSRSPARSTQPENNIRARPCTLNLASICSRPRPALQHRAHNERMQRIWRATQDDLNALTLF